MLRLAYRLQTSSFNSSVSTDRVLHPAHCGERIHSFGCRRPLRCCVSPPHFQPPSMVLIRFFSVSSSFLSDVLQTENLNSSFQVSLLTVWQPDRYAVPGQRRVRVAAAAALLSHDGTSGGRPLLGTSLKLKKKKSLKNDLGHVNTDVLL